MRPRRRRERSASWRFLLERGRGGCETLRKLKWPGRREASSFPERKRIPAPPDRRSERVNAGAHDAMQKSENAWIARERRAWERRSHEESVDAGAGGDPTSRQEEVKREGRDDRRW